MVPVPPFGAVYIQYAPLAPGQRASAFKCVFSGGRVLPDSIADAPGVSAIQWPGGILEMEISCPEPFSETFDLGPVAGRIDHGCETVLSSGSLRINLPDRAKVPGLVSLQGTPALKGDIDGGGQYLVTLTESLSAVTGYLCADRIDAGDSDIIHAMTASGDIVGHGRLEQWMADGTGLRRVSSEPVWTSGGPAWPETAENTMIAAVQAALEGLWSEADNYFVPALADTSPLNAIGDVCDMCLSMKYGLPGSRNCVGLMRMENERLAAVTPLFYRAQMTGGAQGPWQIGWISTE
jgi:hypothetical protein